MSGHNKWSKIKHKKAAGDAKKSQVFGKLARYISSESKRAGGDINAPGLRLVIEKARKANMPSENIERAVLKGTTDTTAAMEPVTYEAYGPGGVALLIEGLTSNRNKTAAELRHLLSKNAAQLALPGAAAWAFTKTADGGWSAHTKVPELSEEDTERLSALVEHLEEHEDVQEVYTNAT